MSRFICISKSEFIATVDQYNGPRYAVIVDTQTGVQYLTSSGKYDSSATVLVDKDGKPLLYPN